MKLQQKHKEYFKNLSWAAIKAAFVRWAKKEAVKTVLKKLAITGGIKGWLVSFVVNHLIEAGDEYILEPLILKFGYKREVKDGKKIYSKIINAEDSDDWRDAARDI